MTTKGVEIRKCQWTSPSDLGGGSSIAYGIFCEPEYCLKFLAHPCDFCRSHTQYATFEDIGETLLDVFLPFRYLMPRPLL